MENQRLPKGSKNGVMALPATLALAFAVSSYSILAAPLSSLGNRVWFDANEDAELTITVENTGRS